MYVYLCVCNFYKEKYCLVEFKNDILYNILFLLCLMFFYFYRDKFLYFLCMSFIFNV